MQIAAIRTKCFLVSIYARNSIILLVFMLTVKRDASSNQKFQSTLSALCDETENFFKWLHNSKMEMRTEAAYQCGIFTCLFIPTLGCFYPVGHLIAYHYLDEST